MATLITQIPPLNPNRFVKYNQPRNPAYHWIHYSDDFFYNSIPKFQFKKQYYQKFELHQRITVQIHTQTNGGVFPPKLELIDVNGNLISNINGTAYYYGTITYPGNLYDGSITSMVGSQLDSSLWSFRLDQLLGASTGIYLLRITNFDQFNLVSEQWISEPMQVLVSHPNTILAEYSNNISKNHIIIDGWGAITPLFGFRCEAYIRDWMPYGNDVSYRDVNYDFHNLDLHAWSTMKFEAGGKHGVPMYVVDKLKDIWTCDNIRLDGEPLQQDDESGGSSGSGQTLWNIQDPKTSAFIRGSIPIRYLKEVDSFTTIANKMALSAPALSYPCAIAGMSMTDGTRTVTIPGAVLNNSTDANNYLATMTGTITDINDLLGEFTLESGVYYYTCGPFETFGAFPHPVLTTHLDCTVDISIIGGGSTGWHFDALGGNCVVDWGDSHMTSYLLTTMTTTSHFYSAAGNKTMRIFTDNNMTVLKFNFSSGIAFISAISSTSSVSSLLNTFYCNGQDFSSSSSISTDFLNNAKASLESITMTSNNIKGISPALFSAFTFPSITFYVDFSSNELAIGDVDNIFNDVYTIMYGTGLVGTVNTISQTPTAAPSGASLTNRNLLSAAGWTLIHD